MKDGKFGVGDKIECVKLDFNAWITKGNKYTVKNIWNEAVCPSIQIVNDSGIDTLYPAHLFKLVEPEFKPEYFSALNEEEAEKYVGKVMEFADGNRARNSDWLKGRLIDIKPIGSCPFHNSNKGTYMFIRTCPEIFHNKKIKKTIERWVNVYKNGTEKTYRYFEDAMADRDDIGCVACLHLTKEYEVEE